jgi:hypothetical protein
MLTIHHLTTSQSERVVWLCEELGIDYKLVVHERLPETKLAPPSLRNPVDLRPYAYITAYLRGVAARSAYTSAMQKGNSTAVQST